jgi:uncharacterized membrane protein
MHSDELEARVGRLEADVAALERLLALQSNSFANSGPRPSAPRPPTYVSEPPKVTRALERNDSWGDPGSEANVFAAWLARLGALSIVLGAAFAFKLAMDRGLVGPGLRVVLGVAAGLGFIGVGELARRRNHLSLSQALCAAGVVLLYLSILAGLLLYALLPPALALGLLIMVATAGGLLGIFHDSIALGALSALGAYLNALLLMENATEPTFLYTYLVIVSIGFVGLGCYKFWRPINVLALGSSWLILLLSAGTADFSIAFTFATALFVVFAAAAFLTPALSGRAPERADAVFSTSSAVVYVVVGTGLLELSHPRWTAAFALTLAVIHLALSIYAFHIFPNRVLGWTMQGLAMAMLTLAIALQFDGLQMTLLWAIEGALLAWLASRIAAPREAYLGSAALLVLSILGTCLQLLAGYRPEQLLLTEQSALILLQVAIVYAAARWLDGTASGARTRAIVVAIAASMLTLGWLSVETIYHVARGGPAETTIPGSYLLIDSPLLDRPTVQFSLYALWSVYASVLLAAGIVLRLRWARLSAVSLFGVVIIKMVTTDLLLLDGLQRTAAFTGLGVLLLIGSFLYGNFRDAISTSLLGEEAHTQA